MLIFELVQLDFENLTFNLEDVFRDGFKKNHKQNKIFNILKISKRIKIRIYREFTAHFSIIRTKCQEGEETTAEMG